MNTKVGKFYDIVGGPNKDLLFDACKYACVKNAKLPVSFEVAVAYTMPANHPDGAYVPMDLSDMKIFGIENEDGSGESYNLRGTCKANLDFGGEAKGLEAYHFRAYYNTRRRKGFITFE